MAETRKCPQCGGTMVRKNHRGYEVYSCGNCSSTINCSTGKTIAGNGKLKFLEKIYVSCPSCSAPLYTKRNQGKVEMECPYCLHKWKFETGAPKLNENQWNTVCPKCGEYVLINKNEGPRKIECPHCHQFWRFQSDTCEYLPDAEVREDCIIVTCPD